VDDVRLKNERKCFIHVNGNDDDEFGDRSEVCKWFCKWLPLLFLILEVPVSNPFPEIDCHERYSSFISGPPKMWGNITSNQTVINYFHMILTPVFPNHPIIPRFIG
jgi:hypothetical protein